MAEVTDISYVPGIDEAGLPSRAPSAKAVGVQNSPNSRF